MICHYSACILKIKIVLSPNFALKHPTPNSQTDFSQYVHMMMDNMILKYDITIVLSSQRKKCSSYMTTESFVLQYMQEYKYRYIADLNEHFFSLNDPSLIISFIYLTQIVSIN